MARKLVNEALEWGRLSYGPLHREFEQRFAERHEVKHAIFTASGTCALQLALEASTIQRGWDAGSEVIVPAVTFPATINAVIHANLRPVLADIDPETLCIDPHRLPISEATRCIIPVHLLGLPADMSAISAIAAARELAIVEDSCQAVVVDTGVGPVGSVGNIGCFSTYISHHLSTGVGGFAVTSDPQLDDLMRSLANHGRDTSYWNIDSREVGRRFLFHYEGHSWRCTELEAAIGISQLSGLASHVRARRRIWRELRTTFVRDYPVKTFDLPDNHSCLFFPIICNNAPGLAKHLELHGVETRPLFPIVNQPVYAAMAMGDLPVARELTTTAFCIGCHPKMDVTHVANVAADFFG